MNRLRQEMELIPRAAWMVANCAGLGIFLLLMLLPFRQDPTLYNWPLAGKLAVSLASGIVLFIWALLIGYIYADARRRGMRYVMWTLLAALIPNAIGIILYFILRESLPAPCPRCRALVRPGFAFCPTCGAALKHACPQCLRTVEAGWSHCASCGASLKAA
jgi:RNA polymerase subunit RPABC4/transcription elongation factor Spt4